MRTRFGWLLCLIPTLLLGQNNNISGDWLISTQIYGHPLYQRLVLKLDAGKLSGSLGEDKLEGDIRGTAIHFVAKDTQGNTSDYTGSISGETISGRAVLINPEDRVSGDFTARRVPRRPAGPPQRHEFTASTFYREFSAATKAVLTVWPGDSVHTTTVDAGGKDENGVTRGLGGNPETGPFYVETAVPGDTLAVHFTRIRLNRDWASSDDAMVDRALDPDLAVKMKDGGKSIRWRLDRERGVAAPENAAGHLKNFTVPLRPMLGCVAVAPGFASAPVPTFDSGRFGGNMDFNELVEGTTVYLPVEQPGALLYVGDGHAGQGDGEFNGNALETSMEIEFTVDVLPGKSVVTPRVESPTHLMVVALAGSLDAGLRLATASLAQWLEDDYQLTPSEIAQVLGSSVELKIGEVADRNVGVIGKLNKQRLAGLTAVSAAH